MARSKEFDKDVVLEKAVDLFWIKGFNATSMQDLVDGLGISRSSLYDTFGSKEDLFYAALEKYNNSFATKTIEALLSAPSPIKAIKNLFMDIISAGQENGAHKGCLLVNTTTELAATTPKANDFICKCNNQMLETLIHIIEKGQQLGEMHTRNTPTQTAHFLMNAFVGMRVATQTRHDKQTLLDTAAIVVATIKA